MTHQFDAKETQNHFDKLANQFSMETAPRDEIFLELILPQYQKNHKGHITVLDFGCGGGALVLKMLDRGINARGIEKHNNLCKLAKERLNNAGYDESNIIKGGIKKISNLQPASFDFVVVMGVFQYLSPEDYHQLFVNIYPLLKPGGHLVGSFQNAFFDLFTFNKYTVDFWQEKVFEPLGLDRLLGDELINDLKGLITNPEKPDFSPTIARDNIYVRTTNPLTIAEELKNYNFHLIQKYFYTFYFVPRLIEGKYMNKLKEVTNQFEIKRSTEWFGHFMANAFVVDFIKELQFE